MWISKKEKDNLVNVSRVTAFLGFLFMIQLHILFEIINIFFPEISNPLLPGNIFVSLLLMLGFTIFNYFIFFKGKGMQYYTNKFSCQKKWQYSIYAIAYPLVTVTVLILITIISKKLSNG